MKGYSKMKIIHSPSPSRSKHSTSPEHQAISSKKTDQEPSEFQESSINEIKIKINNNQNSKNTSLKTNQDNPFLGFNKFQEEYEGEEISNKEITTSNHEDQILSSSRSRLKRNSSVSAASTSIHSAMKNAFSMRRSTSVSDRYCRIHDQSSAIQSPTTHHHHHHHGVDDDGGDLDANLNPNDNADANGDDIDVMSKSRSAKKKNTRSRILKACKKLIGK